MDQLLSLIHSLPPQMKVGAAFFSILSLAVFAITKQLIESTKRERLADILLQKQKGSVERTANAVLSTEKQVKRNSTRGKKLPFEAVNFKAISRDLRKAGLPPVPPLVLVAATIISFMIARFILNVPIFSLRAQALAVFPAVYLLVRYPLLNMMIDSRNMKALGHLITFIESVQRAVSVGTSPDEAVAEAISETEAPLRETLLTIKELIDLGYDFIEAINLATEQVDLAEFDIFAASLTAQSATGGTIGDVLREVAEIARTRLDLKRKIATMTAEGRFNALLLGSLPIGLSLYLRSSQPDYFNALWTDPVLGSAIFFGTLGMATTGAVLAMRISKIRI